MSFPKAPTKRFNEILSCAPPPGVYDPQVKERVAGTVFEKTDRFKVPKDPGPASSSYSAQSSIKSSRRPICTSTPCSDRKASSLVSLEKLPPEEQIKQFGSAPNLTDSLKEQHLQAEEIKTLRAKVQELSQRIQHDDLISLEMNAKFDEMQDELQKRKENEMDLAKQLKEATEKILQLESVIAIGKKNFQENETQLLIKLQTEQENLKEATANISELRSSNLILVDHLSKEKNLLSTALDKNEELQSFVEELQEIAKENKDLLNIKLKEKEALEREVEKLEASLNENKESNAVELKEKGDLIEELCLEVKKLQQEKEECLKTLLVDVVEQVPKNNDSIIELLQKWLQYHKEELNTLNKSLHDKHVIFSEIENQLHNLGDIVIELTFEVTNFGNSEEESESKVLNFSKLSEKDNSINPLEILIEVHSQLLQIKHKMFQNNNIYTNLALEVKNQKEQKALLYSQVESLQDILKEKSVFIDKLNSEIEILGDVVSDLNSSNKLLAMEIAECAQKNYDKDLNLHKVKNSLAKKESEFDTAFFQLQHEKDERMKLVATNLELESKLTENSTELSSLRAIYEQLLHKVCHIEQANKSFISRLEFEQDEYQSQLSEVESALTQVRIECLKVKECEHNWSLKAQDFQSMIDHLKEANTNLINEKESFEAMHKEKLMGALTIIDEDKKWMESSFEEVKLNLENQRENFLCKLTDLAKESDSLKATLVSESMSFTDNIADLCQHLNIAELNLTMSENEICKLKELTLSLKNQLEEKQETTEDCRRLAAEVEALEEKLKNSMEAICSLNEEKEESFCTLETYLVSAMEHFITSLKESSTEDKECFFKALETPKPNFFNADLFREKLWEAKLMYFHCQQEIQCSLDKVKIIQSQVSDLEKHLELNVDTVADLKNEGEKKSAIIEDLIMSKEQLTEEVNSYLKEIKCFKCKIENLLSTLSFSEMATANFADDLEFKKSEVEQLNCKLEQLETQLHLNVAITKSLEDKTKANDDIISNLISEKDHLTSQVQNYTLTLSNIEDCTQKLKDENAEKSAFIDELCQRIEKETEKKEELLLQLESLEKQIQQQNKIISNFEVENGELLQKLYLQDETTKLLHQEQKHLEDTKQKLSAAEDKMKMVEEEKFDLQNQLCCMQQENTHLLFLKKEYEANYEARVKQLQEDNLMHQCDMEDEKLQLERKLMAEMKRSEEFEKEVAVAIKQFQEQMSYEKEGFNKSLQESTDMLAMLEEQYNKFSEEKEMELNELKHKLIAQEELYKEKITFVEQLRHTLNIEAQNKMDQINKEAQKWRQLYQDLLAKIEPFKDQLDAYEIEHSVLLSQNTETEQDLVQLSDRYAQLLSHQNHKQKIRHVMKLKGDILKLKKETFRQKEMMAKQHAYIKKLEGERTLEADWSLNFSRRDKENMCPTPQVDRRETMRGSIRPTFR